MNKLKIVIGFVLFCILWMVLVEIISIASTFISNLIWVLLISLYEWWSTLSMFRILILIFLWWGIIWGIIQLVIGMAYWWLTTWIVFLVLLIFKLIPFKYHRLWWKILNILAIIRLLIWLYLIFVNWSTMPISSTIWMLLAFLIILLAISDVLNKSEK